MNKPCPLLWMPERTGIWRRMWWLALLAWATLFASLSLPSLPSQAHDTEDHTPPAQTGETAGTTHTTAADTLFPVDLGGAFTLTDQNGIRRSHDDFGHRLLLVFFGFANCESICPVALKSMLDAVDLLGTQGDKLQPVLITIDPENETPDVLAARLPRLHPRLLGLTGTAREIEAVRNLFRVEAERMGTSQQGNPVFAHGSFVYLLDRNGKVTTLLPPILDGTAMAAKLRPYLQG